MELEEKTEIEEVGEVEEVEKPKVKRPKKPSRAVQGKAANFVTNLKTSYKNSSELQRRRLNRVYAAVRTFEGEKRAAWAFATKVNKAFEIENKIQSRLTSNNPKFIASLGDSVTEIADRYYPVDKEEQNPEVVAQRRIFEKDIAEWGKTIQQYLNNAFAHASFSQEIRRAAKTLVRFGNVYGLIDYKTKPYRYVKNGKMETKRGKEYPCLESMSFIDVLVDPRFHETENSPGVIWRHENVRLSELLDQSDELINLDKIKMQPGGMASTEKQFIYSIVIPGAAAWQDNETKCKKLNVDKFYGYFSPTGSPKDESIYEIWVVNDSLVIKCEEIREIPLKSCACFEDPEQHFAVGFIEPIIGLMEELNFKRNAANDYINQSLYRSYIYDINSGIDPKQLIGGRPNALIATTGLNAKEVFEQHLVEIPHRQIPNEYFANANELNREIQSSSFTIDTTATTSQQGFTNTATGQRIRAYETNTVYAEILRHFEDWLVKLAYQMLEELYYNMDEDIILEEMGEGSKRILRKIMLEDVSLRYNIKVEAGSSSFDSIEQKRDDALALATLAQKFKESGADVNMNLPAERAFSTFENINVRELIRPNTDVLKSMLGGAPTNVNLDVQEKTTEEPQPTLNNPVELTDAIVSGKLQ